MRNILPEVESWRRDGKAIALATVVKVWGSAPRPLGSKMAITAGGDIAGSVSGGCVEGAVYEEAQSVLQSGVPKLVHFGVSQEDAWAVGLSCGGKIDVYVEPHNELHTRLWGALDDERLIAVATVVGGAAGFLGKQLLIRPDGTVEGGLEALREPLVERSCELFAAFRSERFELEHEGEALDVFIEVHPPRPKLIIVGAVHAAIPLVDFARRLGFSTWVVDPRSAFATPERFAHADELLTLWPDEALEQIGLNEATYLVLLSHDLKLDIPALQVALGSPVRYIGALGSKKTHAKRLRALAEAGVEEGLATRIHNPVGLDLGGRRAEEMAVAIIAEIVTVSHGKGVKL